MLATTARLWLGLGLELGLGLGLAMLCLLVTTARLGLWLGLGMLCMLVTTAMLKRSDGASEAPRASGRAVLVCAGLLRRKNLLYSMHRGGVAYDCGVVA